MLLSKAHSPLLLFCKLPRSQYFCHPRIGKTFEGKELPDNTLAASAQVKELKKIPYVYFRLKDALMISRPAVKGKSQWLRFQGRTWMGVAKGRRAYRQTFQWPVPLSTFMTEGQ